MPTRFRIPVPARASFPEPRRPGKSPLHRSVRGLRAVAAACLLGSPFATPAPAQPPEVSPAAAPQAAAAVTPDPTGATAAADSLAATRPVTDSGRAARAGGSRTPAFRVYELQDDKLLRDLWTHAGREGQPAPGRYQILAVRNPGTPGEPTMLLLREGTQEGALPPATQTWLRERLNMRGQDDGATRSLGSGLWSAFWNPFDPLAPYQWETGLAFAARVDGAVFRSSKPLYGQHYDLVFTQRPLWWLTAEVGGHVTRQGGGLYRNLYDPLDVGGTHFTPFTPWWHAALGIPGVKWEISLSNRVFPEYAWLEPHAGEGTYQRGLERAGVAYDTALYEEGLLMKRWRTGGGNPKPSSNNMAHSLHLKAGNIRYMAHFDRDVYRSTIHQLMFEEVRAPFGQWAFGFIAADGVAHSRVRLDLLPLRGGLGPADLDVRARAFLLRVHFDYRDASTFRVGFSSSFHLDAAYLRSGDTP